MVKELNQHGREHYDREWFGGLERVVEQIFYSIWPHRQGSRDWHDNWTSFPLQD
jgi:hypothetical protein